MAWNMGMGDSIQQFLGGSGQLGNRRRKLGMSRGSAGPGGTMVDGGMQTPGIMGPDTQFERGSLKTGPGQFWEGGTQLPGQGGCKCPEPGGVLNNFGNQMPQPGAPNEAEQLDVLGRKIKQQLG